jgi:hypothetical protein
VSRMMAQRSLEGDDAAKWFTALFSALQKSREEARVLRERLETLQREAGVLGACRAWCSHPVSYERTIPRVGPRAPPVVVSLSVRRVPTPPDTHTLLPATRCGHIRTDTTITCARVYSHDR